MSVVYKYYIILILTSFRSGIHAQLLIYIIKASYNKEVQIMDPS